MERLDIRRERAKIENINALPTAPGTFKKISQVIGKPGLTLSEISDFVVRDPALTTKILKMINSAIYGFPGRISSVSHAIMLLGLNVVKGLLLGISVFEIMQQIMAGLWDHSVGCAAVARAIAEKKGVKDPEEASVGGLLHDIGKVIMILQFPAAYEEALKQAAGRRIPVVEAEKEIFQETHAAVGVWLAEKWHFPPNLKDMINYHHRPALARSAPLETAIVHLSDLLVRARGFGFAGDELVPIVHPAAWELLALSEEDLKEILEKLEACRDEEGGLTL